MDLWPTEGDLTGERIQEMHVLPKNFLIKSQKMFFKRYPASGHRVQATAELQDLSVSRFKEHQPSHGLPFSKFRLSALHLSICCTKELSPARNLLPMKVFKDY